MAMVGYIMFDLWLDMASGPPGGAKVARSAVEAAVAVMNFSTVFGARWAAFSALVSTHLGLEADTLPITQPCSLDASTSSTPPMSAFR